MFEDLSIRDTRPLGSKNGVRKALKPMRENVFNVSLSGFKANATD
jgi:hypothetical protein